MHLWGIKLDALRSLDLAQVVSTDSAAWHGNFRSEGDETRQRAAEAHLSMRRYAVTVKLPAYVNRVHAAVAESLQVTVKQDDPGVLSRARRLLRMHGGWTLDILKRRNRTYAYAARRTSKRVERRYLCAVSRLEAWLAEPSSPALLHGPDPAPLVAEPQSHESGLCATDTRR